MGNLSKKTFLISIIFAVIASFLLVPNYVQSADKVIELTFASVSAPTHVINAKVNDAWIKEIEKATNGRVKITLFPGQVLGNSKQAYDIALKGIADISYGWVYYDPGRFPLTEVYLLPSVVPNIKTANHLWDVFNGFLTKEWSGTKVLWLGMAPCYNIQTREKKINTVEDIKGLKLAALGSQSANVVKALGATPLDITAQDMYTALQRGVVDGSINTWSSAAANKHGEVMKYFTSNTRLYTGVFYAVMNIDKYNSLPDDIKKIIDENSGKKMFEMSTAAYWNEEVEGEHAVIQQGHGDAVSYGLSKEELKKIQTLVRPIWDEWVKRVKSKGLPGEKVLESVEKYIEEE